jgi:hypothetical protein
VIILNPLSRPRSFHIGQSYQPEFPIGGLWLLQRTLLLLWAQRTMPPELTLGPSTAKPESHPGRTLCGLRGSGTESCAVQCQMQGLFTLASGLT